MDSGITVGGLELRRDGAEQKVSGIEQYFCAWKQQPMTLNKQQIKKMK